MEDDLLKNYKDYLDGLIRVRSNAIFTNGGKEHASILMSKMFEQTNQEIRMYCEGFKPDLITLPPYIGALEEYLKSGKKLRVLIEDDFYTNVNPFNLLREERSKRCDDTIQYRLVNDVSRAIIKNFSEGHCNFAVFDEDKFRLEISPEEYKAVGSFNSPNRAQVLIDVFEEAFDKANEIN